MAEPLNRLVEFLAKRLAPKPVRVVITDNTRTMLSFSMKRGELVVRAHRMFRAAPDSVCADIFAGYVRTRGRKRSAQQIARARVQAFIESNAELVRPSPGRRRPRRGPVGKVHDLAPIADAVNRRWFGGAMDLELTWSDRPTKVAMGKWYPPDGGVATADSLSRPSPGATSPLFLSRPSPCSRLPIPPCRVAEQDRAPPGGQLLLDFGSGRTAAASDARSLIVINALLDNTLAPAWYIDYLLYHEMLHEHVYRQTGDARHGHRGLFARLERRHPDLARAHRWEQEFAGELWRRHRIREGIARRRGKQPVVSSR